MPADGRWDLIQHLRVKNVIPKYANIEIPYTSPASNITQKEKQTIRLKDGRIVIVNIEYQAMLCFLTD